MIANVCTKCKPRLVVNPLTAPISNTNANASNVIHHLSSPQQNLPSPITMHIPPPQQQQQTLEPSSLSQKKPSLNMNSMSSPTSSSSQTQRKISSNTSTNILASKLVKNTKSPAHLSTEENISSDNELSLPPPPLPPSQPPPTLLLPAATTNSSLFSGQQFDLLKQQYERVLQENNEITSKFKLLEQIHLDAINEYDKQQNRLYNQIQDMHLKCNTFEHEIDVLNKRLSQTKQSNESGLMQIKTLNQQLNEYKEKIVRQEKEIEKFNRQMENLSKFSENLDVGNSGGGTGAENHCHTQDSSRSWNIEV
jgi:DNA repair exonuclease SbcCD ATPase subunit